MNAAARAERDAPLALDREEGAQGGNVIGPDAVIVPAVRGEQLERDTEEGGVFRQFLVGTGIILELAERPGAPGPPQFPALAPIIADW